MAPRQEPQALPSPPSHGNSESTLEHTGLFFQSILHLFARLIRVAGLTDLGPVSPLSEYFKELYRLYLWGESFSVSEGQLDQTLASASELRQNVLFILAQLSRILAGLPQVLNVDVSADPGLGNALDEAKWLYDKTTAALEETMLRLDFFSDVESISGSQTSDPDQQQGLDELVTYIDCLMDLSPALEDAAPDTLDNEVPAAEREMYNVSPNAQWFCRKIRDQYLHLPLYLVERLGQLNSVRYIKIQQAEKLEVTLLPEKGTTADSSTNPPTEYLFSDSYHQTTETAESSLFDVSSGKVKISAGPNKHLHGSGKPAKIETDTSSIYSQGSLVTRDSVVSGGRPRFPPLPEEANRGEPFACPACHVLLLDNTDRKHIIRDLMPYCCIFEKCENGQVMYASSGAWAIHELNHHHGGVFRDTVSSNPCIFCGPDSPQFDQESLLKHVGRHLQEISLAALPHQHESDTTDDASMATSDEEIALSLDDIDRAASDVEVAVLDDLGRKGHIVLDRGEKQYRLERPYLTKRKTIAVSSGGSDQVFDKFRLRLDNAHQTSSLFSNEITFIPRAKFDEIITPEAVLEIIPHLKCFEQESPAKHNELAQDIYYGNGSQGPCRRLLGVLLGIQREEDLKQHMDDQISDDCLPLLSMRPNTDRCILHCRLHEFSHSFNRYPRSETRRQFLEWSQRLTPSYITYRRRFRHLHYVMNQGDPLPITIPNTNPAVNANANAVVGQEVKDFADVIPVRIDASGGNFEHHSLLNPNQLFTLKRLRHEFDHDSRKYREKFEMEVRSLLCAEGRMDYHGVKEVHLVPLLATFEVRDPQTDLRTYYLLFDWVDGNLKDFWKSNTCMIGDKDSLPWLAEQFYQLVRALHIMHNDRQYILSDKSESNLFGRHGDIKPSNFLFFQLPDGRKIFVIDDFGLGRLHSKLSRSQQDPKEIPMTATYRAPEFDFTGGTVSPRSDLFSMGCVFLELITWFFYGYQGVEDFSAARLEIGAKYGFEEDTFFTLLPGLGAAELKGKVKDWIETRLRGHADCSAYLYYMLELIENGMLHPDPEERLRSEVLKKRLFDLSQSCKLSDSFYKVHWRENR